MGLTFLPAGHVLRGVQPLGRGEGAGVRGGAHQVGQRLGRVQVQQVRQQQVPYRQGV